jgi:hypothetical protein|tara:strand:- start:71 stop:262 length:192 start_codon:yes stop_codon:yes gene_type:complete
MEDILLSKKEVLVLVQKLEKTTGMSCQNVRNLEENATDEEYYFAWRQDRNWFRGYADTIYDLT